jgi:energy-converting hydrogenase B subunit D
MMAAYEHWVVLLATVLMLVGALAVLMLRNYLAAVAAASVVSLGAALAFVVLRAPDVALTEAAVGSGLGGVVLALCLRRLGLHRLDAELPAPDDAGSER